MNRLTLAYIRTWSNPSAAAVQRNLIIKYCHENGIQCDKVYEDCFTAAKYKWAQTETTDSVYDPNFPEWSKLFALLCGGEVQTILVDTSLRLYRNNQIRDALWRICIEQGTSVVEVSPHEVKSSSSVIIYHFTDVSETRPRVVLTAVDKLYQKASQHEGWEVSGLLLDLTLKKSNQVNLEKLLSGDVRSDVIYFKSFYHLNTHMVSFWNDVNRLEKNGVRLVSMEEGNLDLESERLRTNNLKVAIYDQSRTDTEESCRNLRLERLEVFVKCRTSWVISGIFLDNYNDRTCPEKKKLVEWKGNYDVVLMDSFSMINPRTNHFCKFKDSIGVPVYSLKEGGVDWHG